jgi:hypothetical protein
MGKSGYTTKVALVFPKIREDISREEEVVLEFVDENFLPIPKHLMELLPGLFCMNTIILKENFLSII